MSVLTTYKQYSELNESEKVVLCWLEPSQRLTVFESALDPIYTRKTNYIVIGVDIDGQALSLAADASLDPGEFFYDFNTSILSVRLDDDSAPKTKKVNVTYRLCFSNAPIIASYDLDGGKLVEYDARIEKVKAPNYELDDEQIGISLEATSNIALKNHDLYFKDKFDKLFWAFKSCTIWSWSPLIPYSEKKKSFEGVIENKSFKQDGSFSVKDFVFRLRPPISQENFSTLDGNINESVLNTPKRRIYGQVKQLKTVGVDNILEGYGLTGTITGAAGTVEGKGVGTKFLDEVSPDDKFVFTIAGEEYDATVDEVIDDENLIFSDELDVTISASVDIKNLPTRPWRKKNLRWHIAGHKLRAPITTISAVSQVNRYSFASALDMFPGDLIKINNEAVFIKRLNVDDVTLASNLQSGLASIGDPVEKNPVNKVFIDGVEAFIDRDWALSNGLTDAVLELDENYPINLSKTRGFPGSYDFTNGSREIDSNTIDPKNDIKTRDFIRSGDPTHTEWYEVLDVTQTKIILRAPYQGTTGTFTEAQKKNTLLVSDDSNVLVSCTGMEYDGAWIKTASDAVKHLVEFDAGLTNINTASFDEARIEAPYILSMVQPESIGSSSPKIKDVINQINGSVFGSLINDLEFNLKYNVLSPEKPSDLEVIRQDDLEKRENVSTSNSIIRKVNLQYSPFSDRFTGEDSFELIEFINESVDNFIGATDEGEYVAFLFNPEDAESIAQRFGLFNSLVETKVSFSTKLLLSVKNLNDKLWLGLDKMFDRFGHDSNMRIGIIKKIARGHDTTQVDLVDLGNQFNRVAAICDDVHPDFVASLENDKLFGGYIVDNDTETPDVDSEDALGANIIG